MYDIGPLILFLEYFVLIGTVVSFIYYVKKKSVLSKRIFMVFASIIIVSLAFLFIVFVLLMMQIL